MSCLKWLLLVLLVLDIVLNSIGAWVLKIVSVHEQS